MPRFEYAGPDPVPDGGGSIARPGEVREMGEVPSWGPWFELDGDGNRIAWHESTGVSRELERPPDPAEAEPAPPAKSPPAASKNAPAKTPAPGEGE